MCAWNKTSIAVKADFLSAHATRQRSSNRSRPFAPYFKRIVESCLIAPTTTIRRRMQPDVETKVIKLARFIQRKASTEQLYRSKTAHPVPSRKQHGAKTLIGEATYRAPTLSLHVWLLAPDWILGCVEIEGSSEVRIVLVLALDLNEIGFCQAIVALSLVRKLVRLFLRIIRRGIWPRLLAIQFCHPLFGFSHLLSLSTSSPIPLPPTIPSALLHPAGNLRSFAKACYCEK